MEKEEERQKKKQETLNIIKEFCLERLNEEYAELCLKLANFLFTEEDPLKINGKPKNIAGAVIHVIATVNLLFDVEMPLHLTIKEIAERLVVPPGPTASRSRMIRRKYGILYFDSNYCSEFVLSIKPENNPEGVNLSPDRKKNIDDEEWLPNNTWEIILHSKRKVTSKALTAVRSEIRDLANVPVKGEAEADLLRYKLDGNYFRIKVLLCQSDAEYFKRWLEIHLPNMSIVTMKRV
ncbi:MAG: DUF6398 domain-containing protein [Hyphomicrobiales bacterium]